jgi:hypothetical protein
VGQTLAVLAVGVIVGILLATTAPVPAAVGSADDFRMGVFEDFNRVSDVPRFEAMIKDLQSRGFDSVMLSNGWLDSQDAALAVSDRLGFDVFLSPMGELYAQWWDNPAASATIDVARNVVYPLVDRLKVHPSLKGYNVADEPDLEMAEKMRLALQAFGERDPSRPAFPVLVGVDRVGSVARIAQPRVLAIDVYPAAVQNVPCDFTLRAFGYDGYDFVSYTREVTRGLPPDVPRWFILQTHGGIAGLREPTVAEIRLQAWLAIGEGARGIYWFAYSSQQGWRGIVDNRPAYDEVTAWVHRLAILRPHLASLQKVTDQFSATGRTYTSTLANRDRTQLYAVIANQTCQAQTVTVTSDLVNGLLRDVESGQYFRAGDPIDLAPGAGRLLQQIGTLAPVRQY